MVRDDHPVLEPGPPSASGRGVSNPAPGADKVPDFPLVGPLAEIRKRRCCVEPTEAMDAALEKLPRNLSIYLVRNGIAKINACMRAMYVEPYLHYYYYLTLFKFQAHSPRLPISAPGILGRSG